MNKPKEKLYRKENWTAQKHKGHGKLGSEYRYDRNTKAMNNFEADHKSMKKMRHGYDYTPLFRFLFSKVGQLWDEVYSEAKSRLDKEGPIFWMVKFDNVHDMSPTFRCGENSFYSTLTVDKEGLLRFIDENALPWPPSCTCCTYTFNGKVITRDDYPEGYKFPFDI